MQEIHEVGADAAEFKNHQLPLARIKKVPLDPAASDVQHKPGCLTLMSCCEQIMKSDEDVRMISAEAPVLFARVSRQPSAGSPSCSNSVQRDPLKS